MKIASFLNTWFLLTIATLSVTLYWSISLDQEVIFTVFFINLFFVFGFYTVVAHGLSNRNLKYYSKKRLLLTVGIFSFISVYLLNLMYYYYSGTFFEFTAVDSIKYHRWALEMNQIGYSEFVNTFLKSSYGFDDLGAVFITSFAYLIYPSPVIFNLLNIIAGLITILALYRISINFMSKKYAYITALSYGMSSFVVYLYSTGMKESFFTMFVILFFDKCIAYSQNRKNSYLVYALIFFLATLFFRPAVSIIMASSVACGYLLKKGKQVYSYILLLTFVFGLVYFFEEIYSIQQYYFRGIEHVALRKASEGLNTSTFTYIVSYLSAMFGPLPTFYPHVGGVQLAFYSTGLGFRVLLSAFFWFGVARILKTRESLIMIFLFFVLFEMFVLALVLESFELRLNSPHLPFIYLISFWYLYKINIFQINNGYKSVASKLLIAILSVIIIAWNFRILL